MLKYFLFWVAFLWTGIVSYFCLVSSDKLPEVTIPNIDKVVHIAFHFALTFFWFLFFNKHLKVSTLVRPLVYAVAFSFVFGITIEILQELCTTTRHADVSDVLANTVGETTAVIIVLICNKYKVLPSILKK